MFDNQGRFTLGGFTYRWILRSDKAVSNIPADPHYPNGRHVTANEEGPMPWQPSYAVNMGDTCVAPLPYPAVGYGVHEVQCAVCGAMIHVMATGKADDPRSIRMNCNKREKARWKATL